MVLASWLWSSERHPGAQIHRRAYSARICRCRRDTRAAESMSGSKPTSRLCRAETSQCSCRSASLLARHDDFVMLKQSMADGSRREHRDRAQEPTAGEELRRWARARTSPTSHTRAVLSGDCGALERGAGGGRPSRGRAHSAGFGVRIIAAHVRLLCSAVESRIQAARGHVLHWQRAAGPSGVHLRL